MTFKDLQYIYYEEHQNIHKMSIRKRSFNLIDNFMNRVQKSSI